MAGRRVRIEFEIPEDADWDTVEALALEATRKGVEQALGDEAIQATGVAGGAEEPVWCPGCGKKGQSETG